jgi:hypothetical protein
MELSGQLYAPPFYPQGKSPHYPLDRRLGGSQSRSGRGGEENKFPAHARNRNLETRSSSPWPRFGIKIHKYSAETSRLMENGAFMEKRSYFEFWQLCVYILFTLVAIQVTGVNKS